MKRRKNEPPEKPVNLGRHAAGCNVCNHEKREQIEADCTEYGLADRTTIYRHAWALGLMEKRRRNVRAALESIIEKAANVEVTAAAVVQAIATYARINANGLLIERKETVNLNELFERMSREELLAYAERGVLPSWYTKMVGATEDDGRETLIQ
jgi:hexokinase